MERKLKLAEHKKIEDSSVFMLGPNRKYRKLTSVKVAKW